MKWTSQSGEVHRTLLQHFLKGQRIQNEIGPQELHPKGLVFKSGLPVKPVCVRIASD